MERPFNESLDKYMEEMEVSNRLQESVERARAAGVPEELILHDYEEGEAFFMS